MEDLEDLLGKWIVTDYDDNYIGSVFPSENTTLTAEGSVILFWQYIDNPW